VTAQDGAGGGANATGMPPTVFLADPSAEAERITQVLRNAGYLVADVPLSMLYSRVAVQRPDVVLLDVDTEGALAEVRRVRELPDAGGIDFVYFGNSGGPIANADDALDQDASGFFARPVDISGLLTKLRVLTGGPELRIGSFRQASTPPPSIPAARHSGPLLPHLPSAQRSSSIPPAPRGSKPPSVLPPAFEREGHAPAMSAASLMEDPGRAAAMHGPISNELQRLLEDAEKRVAGQEVHEAVVTPEEEIESVLPADVLAALDEPLDDEVDESASDMALSVGPARAAQQFQATAVGRAHRKPGSDAPPYTQTGPGEASSQTTGARGTGSDVSSSPGHASQVASRTGGGTTGATSKNAPGSVAPPTTALPFGTGPGTGSGSSAGAGTGAGLQTGAGGSTGPGPQTGAGPSTGAGYHTGAGAQTGGGAITGTHSPSGEARPISSAPTSIGGRAGSTAPGSSLSQRPKIAAQVIASPVELARLVSEQIRERKSGALCLESADGMRRIVFAEGDFVTAASGRDEENLLSFLVMRGDLPRAEGVRLAGKIPPFGRHAGAALVAHGHISQDQLWSALRAHAEWIALLAMKVTHGSVILEPEPTGRLRGEPSVFGGTTGAAVFVDLVRRAYSPDEAIAALGGQETRLADGAFAQLLSEAGLDPADERLVLDARGGTLAGLIARSPDADIATCLLGLSLLGVIEAIPPVRSRADRETEARDEDVRMLDEEAILARVKARMQLVEEGDYFAVLGVSRDATSYEVRRAFLELRRAFEPSRLLTPRLSYLVDDVKKIVLVLEEAYDILREAARRERYRRAIEATPRG
jgi:hypothetical protein